MLEKDDAIGDYKLIKFLGRGQFGEVWLAEKQLQFSTHKFPHALKFLSNLGDEITLKAAKDEVDTWIQASGHPNVMSVLDMIIHNDHIIIVSEFAEGGSLKNWLIRNGGKAPSNEIALEMLSGILRGIEHLHSRNVIHRDLKPDNILLQGNSPRITDFGVSRIVSTNSMSVNVRGTPLYMSPESLRGSKLPQGDIWSAGIILYEMLTGKRPYDSESLYGLVMAIQHDAPKPLPDNIPLVLREIVENALQKDVNKRFKTAGEMRVAVGRVIHLLKIKDEAVDNVAIGEIEDTFSSQPTIEDIGKKESNTNEIIEIPQSFTTQKIPIPPETEISENLESLQRRETGDKNESGWGKNLERENEIVIYQEAEREHSQSQFEQRKRKLLVAGSIGGLFLGLAVTGSFIAFMSFGNSVNSNIAGKKITNTALGNTLTNEASRNPKPDAPEGMVYVTGGEFTLGRNDGKSEAEKPQHKVSVNPFFMDIYETTNEQYAAFVKATSHQPPTEWKNGTYPNGQARFPVIGVDWDDANAYAKWANKRLPSEEEWEFAARGTNNLLYPWGNDWKRGNANVSGQSFVEVGKYKGASPFGINDMSGNAWEWTASDFKAYPNGKLPAYYAGKSNLKTIRGGSFGTTGDFATTTYRLGWEATGAINYNQTGFRCVKDIER